MTAHHGLALLASMLGAWATIWLMAGMMGTYLRPAYAEDDAGSGRYLIR